MVSVSLDTVVFYVTHEFVVQRRENHGIYEDLISQLCEKYTPPRLTFCPNG